MLTKRRKRKRAKRRSKRGVVLGRVLTSTLAALAIVSYILMIPVSCGLEGDSTKSNMLAAAAPTSLSDLGASLTDSTQAEAAQTSQPATSTCKIIMIDETPGEAAQEAPRQSGRNLTGGADDYALEQMQQAGDLHSWYADNAIAQERWRQRAEIEARIRNYMISHNHIPGLIERIPRIVDLAIQTNNDPRLCAVTANEESSGGRGSGNLFGVLGCSIGSTDIDTQINYYFSRITSYGFNGDVWHIAWFWHGGGCWSADHVNYANNVTSAVQAI